MARLKIHDHNSTVLLMGLIQAIGDRSTLNNTCVRCVQSRVAMDVLLLAFGGGSHSARLGLVVRQRGTTQ
eukprot:2490888-Pleurochrysis_carterae.AAC.1